MTTPSVSQMVPATDTPRARELGYRLETTCAVSVRDFKAASQWYQDVLGFTPLYAVEEMGWGEFATNVPGMSIGLSQVQGDDTVSNPGGATLTFGVQDIEKSRALLEAKGVRFDGDTQEIPGMVKLATFFDPDGNTFMLAQGLG